jgi:hypothetical protein
LLRKIEKDFFGYGPSFREMPVSVSDTLQIVLNVYENLYEDDKVTYVTQKISG